MSRRTTDSRTCYVNNPRAYDVRELTELARRIAYEVGAPCRDTILSADEPRQGFELINHGADPREVICATGSFFIAAEILAITSRR